MNTRRIKKQQSEEDKRQIFESLPVPQAVRIMAVPMIISQVIVLIYNMADTFYVGRTGDPYMVAGISMVLPVFNLTLALAGLAGVGGGTLISRLMGQNKNEEAARVSVFSAWLGIFLAALFSVGLLLFMNPLLRMLGADDTTIVYARQYVFFVLVIGGIPTVLSNVLANLVRSVGYSGKASFGIAMGGILNIILDPLFMFIILPAGCGVLGVGIATCISNCMACIYFLVTIRLLKGNRILTLNPGRGLPSRKSIAAVFSVGIPSSIVNLLFDVDYMVIDRLMVTYGDIPLAAVGIVLKVERFPLNVGVGLCQGMVPLIAYNFASKDYGRMKSIIHYSRKVGLIIGFASIVLYEIFARQLMTFFISDPETVLLGVNFVRIRILATPFMFLCFSTVNIFNAYGEGKVALFLGVARWLVINIPMLFLLNRLIGMYGLVWSQLISDVITATVSFWVYGRYNRKLTADR